MTLGFNSVDYDLFIASYTPGQAAVPGTGECGKSPGQCGPDHLRFFDQLQHVHDHLAGGYLPGVAGG